MQQLFLIRHGQSTSNAEKKVAGTTDAPLSEVGIKQSELAGSNAKEYFHFDLIVCSPLLRAKQTATIIAKGIGYDPAKLVLLQNLKERDLGALEGLDYAQAPQYNGNYEDAEGAPGIEPLPMLYERAKKALDEIAAMKATSVLIVCHNGIGRMLKVVANHEEPEAMYAQARLENAIIYKLR
jgi:probable phosphoglycerate mutase